MISIALNYILRDQKSYLAIIQFMLTFKRAILLACTLLICSGESENLGHYLAPSQLTQNETQLAIDLFLPKLEFGEQTFCWLKSKLYEIKNYQISMNYQQKSEKVVIDWERVSVSEGIVEIQLKFNYTMRDFKTDNYITGWVSGTAYSEPISYSKNLTVKGSWPSWNLTSPLNFNIKKGFTLKYMNPYNPEDAQAIVILLQGTQQQIDLRPSPLYNQIKLQANPAISDNLKTTINKLIVEQSPVKYTYTSASGNVIESNITRNLRTLSLSPKQGFLMTYYILSSYWSEEQHACFYSSVPKVPIDQKLYGSHATIHSHCLYLGYAYHMYFYGYYNKILDQAWDVPDFSFKAGSLYSFVEGIEAETDPSSPLAGSCGPQMPDNDTLFNRIKTTTNSYLWNISFNCNMTTKSKSQTNLTVLNFTARVIFKVAILYDYDHLTIRLDSFEKVDLAFRTVGNFKITDQKLAADKAAKVLKNIIGTNVYGTGYPISIAQNPGIQSKQTYVIYYDKALVPKNGQDIIGKQKLREQVVEQ